MNEETASPPPTATTLRPPDFLLPKADGNPARGRPGVPKIYLSWGGEVYGPATVEEVMAGLRASFYEPATIFWFEGRDEWSPLSEFSALAGEMSHRPDVPHPSGVRQESNPEPLPAQSEPSRATRKKSPTGRPSKPTKPPKPPGGGYRGYWVVFAFVLVAIALTVGLLLLLANFT